MTDGELDALRNGEPAGLDDARERLVLATTTALASQNDLSDDEYNAARDGLGESGLFELTTLVGYYATLAVQLRVFRVGAPAS